MSLNVNIIGFIFSKLSRASIFILSILLSLFISFYLWQVLDTGWWMLTSDERKIIQEYKKEVGYDVIYCMKVEASRESYDAIIKNRALFSSNKNLNKIFANECKDATWWDLNDNISPEYFNDKKIDTLELITRVNGVIYFVAEVR